MEKHTTKDMKKDTRSRKYQLTWNNPQDRGETHDKLKEILMKKWGNSVVYYCLSDEIGETGTPHTHMFVCYQNAVRFSSIKDSYPSAHIEVAKGSPESNRAYIRKDGKWAETAKAETVVEGTFEEYGFIPKEGQGRRNDLNQLYEQIKAGYTNAELLENDPDNMLRLSYIDRTRNELLTEKYKGTRRLDLQCIYVCGETECGKTKTILDEHGDENVCRVTDYKHPFDHYAMEDVLVFDEFRSDLPIGAMLNYMDIYPLQLPARYNNKTACYHYVYLVSNWKLEDQYQDEQLEHKSSWAAFLRRIKKVREYTGRDEYVEYSKEEYINRVQPVKEQDGNPFLSDK